MIFLYIVLGVIVLLLAFIASSVLKGGESGKNLVSKIDLLHLEMQRLETSVKTEIALNRKETFENAALARRELGNSLFSFEEKLNHLTNTIDHKLTAFSEVNTTGSRELKIDIKQALDSFKKDLSESIHEFNAAQKENFYALLNKQSEQNSDTGNRLSNMQETLQQKLTELQRGNEHKLEQIRNTVDEKLQQTLEARLGQSFKLVSDRLEAVHKGLGDMQQLATGVGDLKRVLNNVKSRGVLGEYQLENLLEQILTTDQYAKNVKTKQGSNAIVEFAVKLPGKDSPVWLPIDSKFPKEDFEWLTQAYEHGDPAQIEESRKAFIRGIKKCAGDICSRYIDPPNTTDFAILFLPFESLYAEVLRTPGLFESIRIDCKINIAGPSTLSAFLSSLQMGFRTLAIEKRSGEVWQLLSAVKTEFDNFGGLLEKAQKNIQAGLDQLENVAGVRTRAIQKRLKGVDTITAEQVKEILPELAAQTLLDDEETA